ncbi:MAG: hypothetical protein ACRD29_24485 [Acidimicrobiales bacterium]
MFAVDCPGHGSRVLLGPRAIEELVNTDAGIVVRWRCRCGTTGTVLTGVRAPSGGRTSRRDGERQLPPAA